MLDHALAQSKVAIAKVLWWLKQFTYARSAKNQRAAGPRTVDDQGLGFAAIVLISILAEAA
jgi:hypothetical protein